MNSAPKTLVVIGGGAAGSFCAVNAARLNQGIRVIILEKTNKLLSKVRISGGGRCNVTHACFDITEMSKKYPRGQHFVKKTFHQFFTSDTVKWFGERSVVLKTEEDGRMFPDTDSSSTIIDCLLKEADRYKVDIRMNAVVGEIVFEKGRYSVDINRQAPVMADFICVATGGYPKAMMFDWLIKLGHTVSDPVPSLFTFNLAAPQRLSKHPITTLMGISVENARIRIEGSRLQAEGPLLITHWGFSGPAVLRLSAFGAVEFFEKDYSFTVHINWLGGKTEQDLKPVFEQLRQTDRAKKIINLNFMHLPKRLWEFFLETSGVSGETRMSDLNSRNQNALIQNMVDYKAAVSGKTTFKEEFVTAGGVRLSEIDPNTMMSRILPSVYFAGEVMDVDGITGGFNFQHAWTSGYIAANSIARSV